MTVSAWQGGCLWCSPLDYGASFVMIVGALLVVLLIAALCSIATRGGVPWIRTEAGDRAEAALRDSLQNGDAASPDASRSEHP